MVSFDCELYHNHSNHFVQYVTEGKAPEKDAGVSALIVIEKMEIGTVKLSVIFSYIKACTWIMSGLTILFYVITNVVSVAFNFWLAEWSNAEGRFNATNSSAWTVCDHPDNIDT